MKLRFEINQAEMFRRGIDCPKSIVSIEVDPAELSQYERDIIADRLRGIDVYKLPPIESGETVEVCRIIAEDATLKALIEAVENDK